MSASRRKSTQVHARPGLVQSLNSPFFPPHIGAEPGREERRVQDWTRPGQTESQVDPSFQLAPTCDSVWPGLNSVQKSPRTSSRSSSERFSKAFGFFLSKYLRTSVSIVFVFVYHCFFIPSFFCLSSTANLNLSDQMPPIQLKFNCSVIDTIWDKLFSFQPIRSENRASNFKIGRARSARLI